MNLKETLSGTGVAIVTPFLENKKIDFDALGKLMHFQIKNGVNYIVILGTTGETPVLSKAEKIDIINFTYAEVGHLVPIVVGVGGNATDAVIEDLQSLPLEGATAILSASPYYNKPTQEGLFQHYKAIAAASPKPVILYNVPARTGKNMTAETTLLLAQTTNIAGIKEASGDMLQCMEILKHCPKDFLVVSGDDVLAMAQLACGMQGVISVAGNCYPKQFSKMVQHGLQHDFAAAKKINDDLLPVYHLLFNENNPAGVKAFLAEMGIIKNELRLPVVPVSAALQAKIKAQVFFITK